MNEPTDTGSYAEQVVPGFTYSFEGALVASERSRFQQIDIYENEAFGRVLLLDGLTQTTERDEFIYHEMLVHVPLIAHQNPQSVLVIGGGDGGTLRRVLEHPSVRRGLMIEIDDRVTALCREHMASIGAEVWDDPRADVRFDDGIAYVTGDDPETFDVILVDSSDPVGPGEGLFTETFYAAAKERLNPGGILVCQSGSPLFQQDELHRTAARIRAVFGAATPYIGVVPTYPGSLWTFTVAGAHEPLDPSVAQQRAKDRGIEARYWTPAIQAGAFALPGLIGDVIGEQAPPAPFGASPQELNRRSV